MSRTRRLTAWPLLLAMMALLALGAAACGDDDDDDGGDEPTTAATEETRPTEQANGEGEEPAGDGASVAIADNSFSPADLEIAAGTTVTWTWSGSFPHSVVGEWQGEQVSSDVLTGSGSFDFTFDEAGTFEYQCGIHGASMTASITVS